MTLDEVIAKAQSGHCMSILNTSCVEPRGKDDYLCPACRKQWDDERLCRSTPELSESASLESECRTPMGAHGRFGDLPPYRGEQ